MSIREAAQAATDCTIIMREQGKAYPRTCPRCCLGPCAYIPLTTVQKLSMNQDAAGLLHDKAHVATPFSHPEIPDNSQPVARVTGYYGGRCVIEPLDRKSIFPVGMAMYVSGGSADAIDWEGVAADQAMTIAMMQVDYQQLSMQTIHDFGREQEARENAEQDKKDAARYRWLRDKGEPAYFVRVPYNLWDETIDAAMQQEQKP